MSDDPDHQSHAAIDQFLLICEKLIYKCQQVQFQYDFRNDKRSPGPSDASRDKKKSKSSQPPRAAPMATEVGEHYEGCGKPNHKRKDCTSGHEPKHPDFNEEGKWDLQDNQGMVGLPRSRRRAPDPAIQLLRRWDNNGTQAEGEAGSTIR